MEIATQPARTGDVERGRMTLADVSDGASVRGEFACSRKDRLTARNGSSYLALELRDRTGTLPARVFRGADELSTRFDRGDAVRVAGTAKRFRGELVAELESIERLKPGTYEPERFLPASYRDREEMEGFLEHLAREVHDGGLREVVNRVLFEGPAADEFRRAPCTRAGHHAYLGGLLEHTVAVGTLVLETCQLHPRLNSDLLMAAALLHDVGKTREFAYGAEIELTEEGRLLGHLTLGAQIIAAACEGLDASRRTSLLNCALSHHGPEGAGGRAERGYASAEALALQRLNALDAGVKGMLENGRPG